MVSTAACYRGSPGFKSQQGRECINFWLKRKFNTVWHSHYVDFINNMLCPIKVNSDTIELAMHTSCYMIQTKKAQFYNQEEHFMPNLINDMEKSILLRVVWAGSCHYERRFLPVFVKSCSNIDWKSLKNTFI